jgi:hypothetical protein
MDVLTHLHDLILELGQEEVDNLVFLDRKGVKVDLLHALDLAGLHQTTELGHGLPLFLVALRASTATATSTSSAAITAATTVTSTSRCAATSTISHVVI